MNWCPEGSEDTLSALAHELLLKCHWRHCCILLHSPSPLPKPTIRYLDTCSMFLCSTSYATLRRESFWNSLDTTWSWQKWTIWLKIPWPWQTAFSQGARKWYSTQGARQCTAVVRLQDTTLSSLYHATNTQFVLNTNHIFCPAFSLNVAFGCKNVKDTAILEYFRMWHFLSQNMKIQKKSLVQIFESASWAKNVGGLGVDLIY